MGKRGPKRGHGGRPIQYDDAYHLATRVIASENRAKKRRDST